MEDLKKSFLIRGANIVGAVAIKTSLPLLLVQY